MSNEKRVLVIDDDEVIQISCQEILQKSGYTVEAFDNGHDGIARFKELRPQLLVVDIKMRGLDGFQVVNIVRGIDPDIVIVVITGYATIETAVEAMKVGAYDFLPKPFTPDELRLIINRGYERWRLAWESKQLQREKEEVERKFVTLVSHQLRSPLVAVKQYLDVLQFNHQGQLPSRVQTAIGRCQVRVEEMLGIIGDWLALSKLEHGVLCDLKTPTDMHRTIERIVSDYQHEAEIAGVTVRTEMSPDLSQVLGDSVSFSMLVGNLLDNAIKYNRRGGFVTLRTSVDRTGPGAGMACIEISDTGIGIPQDDIPRLFGEFFRSKTKATESILGTGLGLAICKKITSDLGGSISVRSEEGKGSTFFVRLPLAETRQEATSNEE